MKRLLLVGATALLLLPTPSCGTLLFPERRDAETSDRIDPNVLLLDGLGLLVFVVPGLVAFFVDFQQGTIFLPEGMKRGEGPLFRDKAVVASDSDSTSDGD